MCNKQTIPATHRGTLQMLPREAECENDFISVENASQNQKIELISHTWMILDRGIFLEIFFFVVLLTKLFLFVINLYRLEITQRYGNWEVFKQQQHRFHCTACSKVTPNMKHTSLIWTEEPPTARNRLSVQIMNGYWGAWPLIWSQTHQDKRGKMFQPPALIETSWRGDQRGGMCCCHTAASSPVFPGSPHHQELWLLRRSCQKAPVPVLKSRHEDTEPLQEEISYRMRASTGRSYCN